MATVEIDGDVGHEVVGAIRKRLNGATLRLGRARGTSYGGEYAVSVEADAAEDRVLAEGISGIVLVLALSDLAILDDLGVPTAMPDAATFGLGNARFLGSRSALRLRRFAPWNAHLNTRDVERQVIEAGSVLAYELQTPLATAVPCRQTVGLWREAGLGRVWLNPPILAGEAPVFSDRPPTSPDHEPRARREDTTGIWAEWLARRRRGAEA